MDKKYYIYMMTNSGNTVIYTGVTGDLVRRAYQHRQGLCEDFTKRYNVVKLVYYEVFNNPKDAITREKKIKGGSRKRKIELITDFNPEWSDLYETLL
jgi:putative endonuclease